jgi:hypothetical protein
VAVGVTTEDRVFSEVKRLCYAGLDEATLLREVADRLRRAVPFEGYCAHAVDPLSGLIANAIPDQMGGEKEARLFLEHLYFADDFNEYNWMVASLPQVKTFGAPLTCGAKGVAPTSSPARSGSFGESPHIGALASKERCFARKPLRKGAATASPAC